MTIGTLFGQNAGTGKLDVSILDSSGRPVIGVRVEVSAVEIEGQPPGSDDRAAKAADTNEQGHLLFANLRAGRYNLMANKEGYATAERPNLVIDGGVVTLELRMAPSITRTDSVEVRGTVAEVQAATAPPNTLPPQAAKETASRPATVADALPLTPGVVREPGGGLILSSSPEHRSALIVNSADVTDPATGSFGLTVPIDSVEVLNVFQTAYLAEYGRFTAGLVSVETKRGGDKWKWELNDPLPDFRIRSFQLRGLKDATPRLNFEGPLIANKLFLAEGFEYVMRNVEVYTLPFPMNQIRTQGVNSFTQLDYVASATHLITGTVHVAPQRVDSPTMDFLDPLQTTPDTRMRNITGTVADHLTLWRGLLETQFSITKFDGASWGKGTSDLVLQPAGNSGNYFADQNRAASRVSGSMSYAFAPIEGLGTHQVKLGGYVAGSEDSGNVVERPIDIEDPNGVLLSRIVFPRARTFDVDDTEKSFFGQDHWILTPRLSVDLGLRSEAQQISGSVRTAPRGGFAWYPSSRTQTVIRGGYGLFYDRVPLNVYGFNRYPDRVVTDYAPDGSIVAGPYVYLNTLGQSLVKRPFVSQQPIDGNFSPSSTIWSMQVEQPLTRFVRLRATFLHNYSDGLVIVNQVAPDPATNTGAYLLEGAGVSRYRQFDVTAQVRLRADRELFISYTRSRARGDLNDFGHYLSSIPAAIIRENEYGTLGTDLPNRFLTWGVIRLPLKFQIAPTIEYRTGFPYIETNVWQNYFGVPNAQRYPNFFSVDSRFSKDFQLNPKYAVRLSITGFNLTNHFNPEAVHNNVADPAFGYFFGHRGRRFTLDFDFLF